MKIVVRLPGWTKSAARVMALVLDGLLFAGFLFTTYLVFAAQGGGRGPKQRNTPSARDAPMV